MTKDEKRKRNYESSIRASRRKKEIIFNEGGGKCRVCGYSFCRDALDFHHKNPENKDGDMSYILRHGSLETARKEAAKCILVCSNCHRAIHKGLIDVSSIQPYRHEKFVFEKSAPELSEKVQYRIHPRGHRVLHSRICPVCQTTFTTKYKIQRFCSSKCSTESQKKFVVSKEELLVLVSTLPMRDVGKQLGVSDTAVKKRCNRLGIGKENFWVNKNWKRST